MHDVNLTAEARRFYERADAPLQRKLDRCFDGLKETPTKHPNVKLLKGRLAGLSRFRVGDYRVVYLINESARTVTVVTIAHRRDVYE
jgi:mRNA interferase RelE/StbE